MISSTRNPKIQQVRALLEKPKARRDTNAFVVEGVRLVEEALNANWKARLVLYSSELSKRGKALVEAFACQGVTVEEVSVPVLEAVSDTQTPQGLLVVLARQTLPVPENFDFALILDRVRDPGNLGAILRTAAAAAVQVVFLAPGSADPFSPKVVRAAMGAHFRLPIHSLGWQEISTLLHPANAKPKLKIFLADASSGLAYTQAEFRSPTALLLGSEADGASPYAKQLNHEQVHIPMPGKTESLNAAAAAAILIFEVIRQRQSIQ